MSISTCPQPSGRLLALWLFAKHQQVIRGLRKEDDPEAAIIFCLRYQGWEISNDPELLLEEIENFRHTMSLAEAARTATGECP